MSLFLTGAFFVILTLSAPLYCRAENQCFNLFNAQFSLNHHELKKNDLAESNIRKYESDFTDNRGIQSYFKAFGDVFQNKLKHLTEVGGHWLDSGAGIGLTVKNYVRENKKIEGSILTLSTPLESENRFQVFKNRMLEKINSTEFKKADLITDLIGPIAYSTSPEVILKKYLEILKDDGDIFLFMGTNTDFFALTNKILTHDGQYLSMLDWISSLSGLKVEIIKSSREIDEVKYERWALHIRKDLTTAINIPQLELLKFTSKAPPEMIFIEAHTPHSVSPSQQKQIQQRLQDEILKNNSLMNSSKFIDKFRSGEFISPLVSRLLALKPHQVWLNISPFHYLFSNTQSLTYENTFDPAFSSFSQWWIKLRISLKNKLVNYRGSSHLNDVIPTTQKVDLITDFNGDFITSTQPDIVLKKYLELLNTKGELYVFLGPEYHGFASDSLVLKKDKSLVTLRKWLSELQGIEYSFYRGGYHWAGDGYWTFARIKRNNNTPLKIPKLLLNGISSQIQTEKNNYSSLIFTEE